MSTFSFEIFSLRTKMFRKLILVRTDLTLPGNSGIREILANTSIKLSQKLCYLVRFLKTVNNAKMNETVPLSQKKLLVYYFKLSKWLILLNNLSKPLQKFPISLVNHEDLRLLIETSKRKWHNFGQINVNNIHNLNLKWSFS